LPGLAKAIPDIVFESIVTSDVLGKTITPLLVKESPVIVKPSTITPVTSIEFVASPTVTPTRLPLASITHSPEHTIAIDLRITTGE
jgi:hypothetical protein